MRPSNDKRWADRTLSMVSPSEQSNMRQQNRAYIASVSLWLRFMALYVSVEMQNEFLVAAQGICRLECSV